MAELTTFGAFSNTMEQANATPEPTPNPTPTPEPIPTPSPESNNQPTPEPTPEPTPTPEENTSSFSLGEAEPAIPQPTPAITAAQPAKFNLDEEIKKVDRKELLKKIGVTDFAIEIDEHITKGGQAVDYLNAKAIDYNSISDDTLLKDGLRKQYPTFKPEQIDLMFERKYGVPVDATEQDIEFANLQKQADAYTARQQKITEQQKFKISDTPIPQKDEAYEQWKQNTELKANQAEQLSEYYSAHEATQKLNESKRVTISLGDGVAPFNFVIDKPEMITQAFTDGGKTWARLTSTAQGEPDVAKQQLIALFSYNPQKFIQDIFKYGQSSGAKGLVEEGQNAQRPQAKIAPMPTSNEQTVTVKKFGDIGR